MPPLAEGPHKIPGTACPPPAPTMTAGDDAGGRVDDRHRLQHEASRSPSPERVPPDGEPHARLRVRAILATLPPAPPPSAPATALEQSTSISSSSASSSSSSPSSQRKKRRRGDEDLAAAIHTLHPLSAATTTSSTTALPRSGGPALSATHEIRQLRQQVAEMEKHLERLETTWHATIPDDPTLVRACEAAKEKWHTTQVEAVNTDLRDKLLRQQLIFASLQSALLQAPLQSNCRELFEALHVDTTLGADPAARVRALHAHCDRGLAQVQAAMRRFTGHLASSPTPYSATNVTGGVDHTFVSTVFILEIPSGDLHAVLQATLGYYALLPREMQRCVGTRMEIEPLNLLSKRSQYARVRMCNETLATTANVTFVARIVDGEAVIHSDTIDRDLLHPPPADQDVHRTGLTALTLTPVTDAATGHVTTILLRRIMVYRYNVLPHEPLIERDLGRMRCVLNGDLLTAVVCQNLRQQRPEVIEQAAAGRYCMHV